MASDVPGSLVAPPPLVGRDREIEQLTQIADAVESWPRFVFVTGGVGIGKTALWRWAVQRHRIAGHNVLATQASEEEMLGPIVNLVDLFEHTTVGDDVLAADADRFERGRRVLTALRALAADAPVVVAIDDVQWLDAASASALRYALRRLTRERVVVLATERTDGSDTAANLVPADRRDVVAIDSLDVEAVRDLLSPVMGALSRPALKRIHELSGGNPMYAIELARAVDLFDDPLVASVPPTLRGIVAGRIEGVAAEVRSVLAVVAAMGPSRVETIVGAAGRDASRLLDHAVAAGLLVVDADQSSETEVVRFEHPLVAAAVLAAMDPLDRQALHARLADTVDDRDARARHLLLSCAEPDADVAAELDSAARRAARRGASALAADLASHSVRVTPPSDIVAVFRRRFAAIMHRAAAGERQRALSECDALVAALPPGPVRAEAITMRVAIDFTDGAAYLDGALTEVGDDEVLRGRIIELRGWMATTYRADPATGRELGSQALAIAERVGDPVLEMLAASSVASASLMLGEPRPELMERSLKLSDAHGGPRLGRWPQSTYGQLCIWCGQLGEARPILESLHEACLRAGMEFQRPYRLLDLALLELAAGNPSGSADLSDDGIDAATDAGNDQAAAWLAYPAGIAAAHLGGTERARASAAVLRSRGSERDGRTRMVMSAHVLGLLALAAGEPARAVSAFEPGLARLRVIGLQLPSVVPILPDMVEALALSGDVAACSERSAELDRQAVAVGQPWVTAAATRGRGLVALAAGREDAAALLAEAAAMFEDLGYRLDAARAVLLRGRALRRVGQRNASAETLRAAQAAFSAMSARPWQAQAASELERVEPGREPIALTPTEIRISELVVAGRRNREIAGELSMSVATVEGHLTRMYRKLHVRSRTELARALR